MHRRECAQCRRRSSFLGPVGPTDVTWHVTLTANGLSGCTLYAEPGHRRDVARSLEPPLRNRDTPCNSPRAGVICGAAVWRGRAVLSPDSTRQGVPLIGRELVLSYKPDSLHPGGTPRNEKVNTKGSRNLEGSIRGGNVESTYFCLQEMLNHVIEEFHEVLHTVPQRERVNTKTVVQACPARPDLRAQHL